MKTVCKIILCLWEHGNDETNISGNFHPFVEIAVKFPKIMACMSYMSYILYICLCMLIYTLYG